MKAFSFPLLGWLLLAACSPGLRLPTAAVDATLEPTAAPATHMQAPTPSSLPPATPDWAVQVRLYPPDARTGMEDLDRIITAVLSGDRQAQIDLIGFTLAACTTTEGLGGPPRCPAGEAEGSTVEVLPILGPEGHFIRRPDLVDWSGLNVAGLVAAYYVSPGAYSDAAYPAGEKAVVFYDGQAPAWVTLQVAGGRFIRIDYGLNQTVDEATRRNAREFILPPLAAGEWAAADASATPEPAIPPETASTTTPDVAADRFSPTPAPGHRTATPPSVPSGTPAPAMALTPPTATPAACEGSAAWFFDHQGACPEAPPVYSHAAAQRFEHGQMIWVEATDVFYLLFDPGAYPGDSRRVFRSVGPLVWKPGASVDNRLGQTPPAGCYEPVSGFGLIWRNEVEGLDTDIRAALGWAREPEFGFEVAFQCEQQQTYSSRTCYLRGPSGRVIELGWGAHVGSVWEER